MDEIKNVENAPGKGYKALRGHWKSDLLAAFSVSLVALPLALGVAYASGAPPMSGIIAALIGGLLTNFYRGSHVGINGPAAGLIIVTLSSIGWLGGFSHVLGAFVISGSLMFLFGLLRLGKYGDFFPVSVIQGMLAAIGLIIVAKQSHVALGVHNNSPSAWEALQAIPSSIINLNPFVAVIAIISIAILVVHPSIKNKVFHYFPSPMWVLIFTIPIAYIFNFFESHSISIPYMGVAFEVGPHLLVKLPENVSNFISGGGYKEWSLDKDFLKSFAIADFSKIGTGKFWLVVISVTLVSSIEGLLGPKAVERLEPFHRKTNLNKDLIMAGLSTVLSGAIGGLPVITVISRSSVNINHGAKTTWSNFFHGVLLLIFILFFPSLIQQIPLAALAAILVYTGYKLASPKVLQDTYRKGIEQMLIFSVTLYFILVEGLLVGIVIGVLFTLALHLYRTRLTFNTFWTYLTTPYIKVLSEKGGKHVLKVKGISNFVNILSLKKVLNKLPKGGSIILDLSHARLIDNTILEYLSIFASNYVHGGGQFEVIGMDVHSTTSTHPLALHVIEPIGYIKRLTKRQAELKSSAADNNWHYHIPIDWNTMKLKKFDFFQTRIIEYKNNALSNKKTNKSLDWEICDLTFDEGALIDMEVLHTTAGWFELPGKIPRFTMEKEAIFDIILDLAQHEDIKFPENKTFSEKYLIKGKNREAIKSFFTDDLMEFFLKNTIYHIESSGNNLLIFRHIRIASSEEVVKLNAFGQSLVAIIAKNYKTEEILLTPKDQPIAIVKDEISRAD